MLFLLTISGSIQQPKRIPKSSTAFDKPERRKVPIEVEYVGRRIPDEFIVGYGLDYDGIYRNLPEVRILREAAEE